MFEWCPDVPLVQSVERLREVQEVTGSSPVGYTVLGIPLIDIDRCLYYKFVKTLSLGEHPPC